MPKAWIENGKIRDIAHSEPYEIFHPDVAQFYDTLVPNEAQNGWEKDANGDWVAPAKSETVILSPARIITAFDIRACLTFAEKMAWDNDLSPEIKTAKTELVRHDMARPEAQEIIDWLVQKGVLSSDSGIKALELY
jgi:hypothetical protein